MRPRRHEDRVKEIVPAIERHVARIEVERHAIIAGPERGCGHDDVAVHLPHLDSRIVDLDASERTSTIGTEVDHERRRHIGEREGDHGSARQRLLTGGRDHERHVVAEIGDAPDPLARKRLADAGVGVRLHALRRADECQRDRQNADTHRRMMPHCLFNRRSPSG